ncbi:MAG: hypothetical protein AAGC66_13465 [Leifsonia sp.]
MSPSERERFSRFPTDEWEARSSRGFFAFFVAYFFGTILLGYSAIFGPPGPFSAFAPQVEAWVVKRYVSLSGQFDWLLPMVFAALVAFGVWTRFNTALSRQERLELGVRQVLLALIAASGCLLATVAIVARIRGIVAPSGTVAPLLGLGVIVAACVEVGRVTPRIPLTVQRANAKRETRRLEEQMTIWKPNKPFAVYRIQAIVVAAVAPILCILGCLVFRGGYPPSEEIAAVVLSFFLALGLGFMSWMASFTRVASLKLVSLRARVTAGIVGAILLLGAVSATGAIAFVFIAGGEPQLGAGIAVSVLWLLVSVLWTGHRCKPSSVAERTLGGWIRVAAVSSMERQLGSQRKRKRRLSAEIRRRSSDGATTSFSRRDVRAAAS